MNAEKDQLTKVITTLKSGIEKFKEKEKKEKYDTFGEDEIKTMLEKFETGLRMRGKSEKEMLEEFCVDAKNIVREVIAQKAKTIAKRFDEWKVEMELSRRVSFNWVLPENVPLLTYQDIKNERHWALLDPHTYLTSNFLWGSLVTVTAAGTVAFSAFLVGTK